MEKLNAYKIKILKNEKYPLMFYYKKIDGKVHFCAMDVKENRIKEIFVPDKKIEKMEQIETCFYFFNQAIRAFNEDARIKKAMGLPTKDIFKLLFQKKIKNIRRLSA